MSWKIFLKTYVWDVILSQKRSLIRLVIALVFLNISQSGLILILGPLLKVLFAEKNATILLGNFYSGLPTPYRLWSISKDQLMFWVPASLVVLGVIRSVCTYFYNLEQQNLSIEIAGHFRGAIFQKLLQQSFIQASRRAASEWMSIIMNDVTALQGKLTDIINGLIRDVLAIVASFVALAIVWWPAALLLLGLSPILALWTGRTGKKIAGWTANFQKEQALFQAFAQDIRSRLEFIRAQAGEDREVLQFSKYNDSYFESVRKSIFTRAVFAPAFEFIGFCLLAGAIVSLPLIRVHLDGTRLVAFFGALGLVFRPLRSVGEQFVGLQQMRGLLSQSLEVLSSVENKNHLDRVPALKDDDSTKIEIEKMKVTYENFSVDLSQFQIKEGQLVMMCGPSGSGKSTVLKVLGGLIHPMNYVSSKDIGALQNLVSYVGQTPFLFKGSIEANLSYGLTVEPSENKLMEALEIVGMKDELENAGGLRLQFDPLRPTLSGGQIQRLVIARALLRDFKVLVLDEATSSIDLKLEHSLLKKLKQKAEKEGWFVLVVSHRFDYIDLYDEIYFLENGSIILRGSPKAIALEPRFQQFVGAT